MMIITIDSDNHMYSISNSRSDLLLFADIPHGACRDHRREHRIRPLQQEGKELAAGTSGVAQDLEEDENPDKVELPKEHPGNDDEDARLEEIDAEQRLVQRAPNQPSVAPRLDDAWLQQAILRLRQAIKNNVARNIAHWDLVEVVAGEAN